MVRIEREENSEGCKDHKGIRIVFSPGITACSLGGMAAGVLAMVAVEIGIMIYSRT